VWLVEPSDAAVVHDVKPVDALHVFTDGPPGTAPLTVMNFDGWCSIAVNGGTESTLGTQLVNVMPGSITLVAKEASTLFEIGPTTWHDTAGDTGAGDPGTLVGREVRVGVLPVRQRHRLSDRRSVPLRSTSA
jgi:hypothetical protein